MNVEIAVLGACLCEPSAYWLVADLLTAEDFGDPRHTRLFASIANAARANAPFDAVTIAEQNPDGLGDYAMDLANSEGWRQANVRAYAELVVAAAMARRIKVAGQKIARLEGADTLGQAQQILAECMPRQAGLVKHIREHLHSSIVELQARVDSGEKLAGLPTGFPGLDDLTGGYLPADYIVMAARPSVGKTAWAVQTMINVASKGKRVLMFSLEMTGLKIANRMQTHIAQIDASGLKQPHLLQEADFRALHAAGAEIAVLPIFIDDTPALTVEAIAAKARQVAQAQKGLDLIIIDYLTQMTAPRAPTTNDALQLVSRGIKALAKQLNVPIIVLSQLNREGEGQRPTLKNLRDTGALEQDADTVMFLHRPNPEKRDHLVLIVEKQRDGETGDIHLHANYRHQRFTETKALEPPTYTETRGFGRLRAQGDHHKRAGAKDD